MNWKKGIRRITWVVVVYVGVVTALTIIAEPDLFGRRFLDTLSNIFGVPFGLIIVNRI